MIKRKLISSALILALVMTVAGCGNAKNKSNSEQNNSQIAQETTQAAAETAKAEEMPYEVCSGASLYVNTAVADKLNFELDQATVDGAAEVFDEITVE